MTENTGPNNKRSYFYLVPLGFALCLCAGLWFGSITSGKTRFSGETSEGKRYEKIRDIIGILDARYVDSVDGDRLFETAIGDMLHQLDPHSNYIPARDLQAVNESIEGKFYGIGIRFFVIRDTLCVTNVIQGSPSEAAGLKAGDKIIAIEGKSIAGKTVDTDNIMSQLKGAEGTEVNITIWRSGKKLPKSIIRGGIPIESVTAWHMLDRETGYIKIEQFSVTTDSEFRRAAKELLGKGMKNLVLDLRNNGGGVLSAAANIADEFLEANKMIVSIRGEHTPPEAYRATSKGMLKQTKAIVLINSNSASASEILAGALQDNDRAVIMGRRSFGKGLVQEDFLLRDGSNLRLTIARYYTPTGRCIQKPYSGDIHAYYNDQLERFDNGEMYAPDTSLFVDSLKFTTPGGRTVYGGGGIMPDVFVPYDSLGFSNYYSQLRYSGAFQGFAFDFVAGKRQKWQSPKDFNSNFTISEALISDFAAYASRYFDVKRDQSQLQRSRQLIGHTLKAEIARQIWVEEGFYYVYNSFDTEIQKALAQFKKPWII